MGTRRTPAKRAPKRPPPTRVGAGLWLRLPVLGQRELDLLGLALVALGVFLAFVFYLGWNGGKLGGGLADGLRYLVGTIAYGVPVTLVAGGAIVVLRPFLPTSRPFGSGLVCLFASLTMAFASGTLGLGPGGARPD
jgi:S-DNA-T family DNA segregation ATPase FtsK/SpoIIIE